MHILVDQVREGEQGKLLVKEHNRREIVGFVFFLHQAETQNKHKHNT
jgi:hypothetical protein